MKFKILNKVFGSGSAPARDRFAFLALVKDIQSFPKTDSLGVLLLDDIKMKENCGMMQIYLTSTTQEYSYEQVGESDSRSFKVKFIGSHPGTELQALEFVTNFNEEEFVVLIPQCDKGIKVLGSPDSPLIFTSSHKSTKDSEKFNFVFEQEVGAEHIYLMYDGIITLNTNIDIDMKDFLELLKGYIKIDGSNLTDAQKQNLRTILGVGGGNIGTEDLSLNENRSFNLKTFFLNFFSNVGLAKVGINKNNPTQALDVVGNIKTDGLILAEDGTPNEVGAIKRNGNEIQFKTSAGWETIMLKGEYVSDSHGVISPDTPAPVGGWKIGWYTPKFSSPEPGTNYPNQNNLKSIEDFFTEFYFDGIDWENVKTKIPTGVNVSPTFDPTTETEAQGGKQIYDASNMLVEKAFSEVVSVIKNFGIDKNYTTYASSAVWGSFPYFNNFFTIKDTIFKTLKIWSESSANIQYLHIRFNPVDNTYVVLSSVDIAVVPGINEFNININAGINETIALKGAFDIGVTAASGDIGYSNAGYPPHFNMGEALSIWIGGEELGNVGYSVPEIKSILKKADDADFNNLLKGRIVSRITLEGQSNAYGVGSIPSLSNAPFSTQPFDWLKKFSRVFIWNPITNIYENLKIGVNTMSPTNYFGPEVGIAVSWLQNNKTGLLFIDKNYGDGQPINYFLGGAYYAEKKIRKEKADLWLKNKGYAVKEIGFLWVQGEGNAGDSSASYLTALNSLIDQRLTDGFITLETVRVLAQIGVNSVSYGAGVKLAKEQYAEQNKLTQLITYTNNYNADNAHLNAMGQILLGLDAGKEFFFTENYVMSEIEGKINWTF